MAEQRISLVEEKNIKKKSNPVVKYRNIWNEKGLPKIQNCAMIILGRIVGVQSTEQFVGHLLTLTSFYRVRKPMLRCFHREYKSKGIGM